MESRQANTDIELQHTWSLPKIQLESKSSQAVTADELFPGKFDLAVGYILFVVFTGLQSLGIGNFRNNFS